MAGATQDERWWQDREEPQQRARREQEEDLPPGAGRGPPAESAAAGGGTGTLTHASEGQGAEREVHDHIVDCDTPAGRAVNHPPDELKGRARLGQRFRLHAGVGEPRFTSNRTRGAPALLKP